MKKTLLVLFILFFSSCFCFSQTKITLVVTNNPLKTAYFSALNGAKQQIFGYKPFQGNTVTFQLQGNLVKGMYRIGLTDSAFIDILGGSDQEIVLETSSKAIIDSFKVIKGDENIRYYKYIQYKNKNLAKLNQITSNFKTKYSGKKTNTMAEERLAFIKGCITLDINNYAKELIAADPDKFSSKIIKAMLVPNVNLYTIENPDTIRFDNDVEFLMLHFFDNIDFSDSAMLNTELLYRSVKYYVEKLAQPRNVTGFNNANTFILKKALADKNVYNYILSMLIDLYEVSQLEEVYLKLFDEILFSNKAAVSEVRYSEISKKVSVIKNVLPGKTASDFNAIDTVGTIVKLSQINKEPLLVFFYSAKDHHADELFSKLEDMYPTNKLKGFEIFAVCTDSTQTGWKTFLRKHKNANWNNAILTEEGRKSISELYNTWALPSIYLMDKTMKIILKPMTIDYLQKEYPEYFKSK